MELSTRLPKKNVSLIKENPELHSDYNEVKYEIWKIGVQTFRKRPTLSHLHHFYRFNNIWLQTERRTEDLGRKLVNDRWRTEKWGHIKLYKLILPRRRAPLGGLAPISLYFSGFFNRSTNSITLHTIMWCYNLYMYIKLYQLRIIYIVKLLDIFSYAEFAASMDEIRLVWSVSSSPLRKPERPTDQPISKWTLGFISISTKDEAHAASMTDGRILRESERRTE